MATTLIDIAGDISINSFSTLLGVPVTSANKQNLVISYTGIADPALTADITEYSYSLDNGTTWNTMTLTDSVITGLAFTPEGAAFDIKWTIKSDLNDDIYNKEIKIKIQATSGDMLTTEAIYNVYLEKQIQDLSSAANQNNQFPEDYKGVDGASLLKNAPKAS